MPRKTKPSAGQNRMRGRHKKWKSKETRKWLRLMKRTPGGMA